MARISGAPTMSIMLSTIGITQVQFGDEIDISSLVLCSEAYSFKLVDLFDGIC